MDHLLLKETLLWIESIPSLEDELINTYSPNGFEYGEEDELEQYFLSKHYYFHRWSRIFRQNRIRTGRNRIINVEVIPTMQRIKLKFSFLWWRSFKIEMHSRCSLLFTVSAQALKYRFKKRSCLLYWAIKAKTRRKVKFIFLKRWILLLVQNKVLCKGFGILCHLKLYDAFKRWHRRSRWPVVNLQRRLWQRKAAFSSFISFQQSCAKSHDLIVIAVRHRLRGGLYEWLHRHSRVQSWKTLAINMSRKHCFRFALQWISCFQDRKGFRLCETACRRFHARRRLQLYFHSLRSNRRKDRRVAILIELRRLFGKFRRRLRTICAIRHAGEGMTSMSSSLLRKSRFVALKRKCDQRRVRRCSLISASLIARRVLLRSALFALSERLVGAHVDN